MEGPDRPWWDVRIAAAVAAFAFAWSSGNAAAAADTFTLAGAVRDGAGPLAGVSVSAYRGGADSACCTWITSVTTDASGSYSLALAVGTYRVRFIPPATSTAVARWYRGSGTARRFEDADDVVLAANTSGVNVTLEVGSSVLGRVTDASGAVPIPGVTVSAYLGGATAVCCSWVSSGVTAADGTFRVQVPRSGSASYRLQYFPLVSTSYVAAWWTPAGAASTFGTATDVSAAADVTGRDITLTSGKRLTGRITDGAATIAGATVNVYRGGPSATCCTWVATVATDADGAYALTVPSGTYRILYRGPEGSAFIAAWSNGSSRFDAAEDVLVSADRSRDVVLALGRKVSGRITSDGTTPVVGAAVSAYSGSPATCCTWRASDTTDTDGRYGFVVPSGPYRFRVDSPPGSALVPRWLKTGAAAVRSFELASDVTVTAARSDLDVVLPTGAHISGTVRDGAGAAVAGVGVAAYEGGSSTCCTWVAGSTSDATGSYDLVLVAGASYRLRFSPQSRSSTSYIAQWWDGGTGAAHFDRAADLALNSDATQDVTLLAGARIAGTVSDANGPLAGAAVSAFSGGDADCCTWVGGTATDGTGTYTLTLPEGTYRVLIAGPRGADVLPRWWDGGSGVRTFDQASDLSVTSASPGAVSMTLANGSQLSGAVIDANGEAIADVGVGVYLGGDAKCCKWITGTSTRSDGSFAIIVPDGSYRLQLFPPEGSGHVKRWFTSDGSVAARFGEAEDVTVAGGDVSGLTVILSSGFNVSGKVTDGSGRGLAGVGVSAFTGGPGSACCTWVSGDATSGSGEFSLVLSEGTYRLQISPPRGGGQTGRWWTSNGGAGDFSAAEDVTVVADATLRTISLSAGSHIRGKITTNGTDGISDVSVNVFKGGANAVCCAWLAGGLTDKAGRYDVIVPAGGTYRFQFWPSTGTTLGRWWKQGASTGADRFDIADDKVVGGNLDLGTLTLPTGFAATGTVTSDGVSPLGGVLVSAFTTTTATLSLPSGTLAAAATAVTVVASPNPLPAAGGGWLLIDSEVMTFGAYNSTTKQFTGVGRGLFGTTAAAHSGNAAVMMTPANPATRWTAGTMTDHLGRWSLNLPSGGSYRIHLKPPPDSGYKPVWLSPAAQGTAAYAAATVIIAAGSYGSIRLPLGTAVTGKVTEASAPNAANGVHGVLVTAYKCDDPNDETTCAAFRSATTGSDGTYTLPLAADTYYFLFAPPSVTSIPAQWLNGKNTAAASPPVTVGASSMARNTTLLYGFAGTVTDASANPISGATVDAMTCPRTPCTVAATAYTDSSGKYHLVVPNGTYTVRFSSMDPGGAQRGVTSVNGTVTEFVAQYCDSKALEADGCRVAIASGGVVKDATLVAGFDLNGTVQDANSIPLTGVAVAAVTCPANAALPCAFVAGATTDGSGGYNFVAPAGTDSLRLIDTTGMHFAPTHYLYDVNTGNTTIARSTAAPVTFSAANDGNSQNVTMLVASGTVGDSDFSTLDGVSVAAVTCPADQSQPCLVVASGKTDAGGNIVDAAGNTGFIVPVGSYKFQLTETLSPSRFTGPLYVVDTTGAAGSRSAAVALDMVTQGASTTITMLRLDGTVTRSIGSALADIAVAAVTCPADQSQPCVVVASGKTDAGGNLVDGTGTNGVIVPSGSYQIRFTDSRTPSRLTASSQYLNADLSTTTASRSAAATVAINDPTSTVMFNAWLLP